MVYDFVKFYLECGLFYNLIVTFNIFFLFFYFIFQISLSRMVRVNVT